MMVCFTKELDLGRKAALTMRGLSVYPQAVVLR
jgi:hypothetical protein